MSLRIPLPIYSQRCLSRDNLTEKNTTYRSSINQLLEQKVVCFEEEEDGSAIEESVDISEEERKNN